jgi:hypothetical protein
VRLGLDGVFLALLLQLGKGRLAEQRVVVHVELGIGSDHLVVRRDHQRVDLR